MLPDSTDEAIGGPYNGVEDETEEAFTRPADRAYAVNIHLESYIANCLMDAAEGKVPWTVDW